MTQFFKIPAVLTIVFFCLSPSASAQGRRSAGWNSPVIHYRLENGLSVVLYRESVLPVVSVVVAYRAGTMAEKPGQSGMAYFVENLMFQGSENIGPLQHVSYIQKAGGELNALTAFDRTVFYQTIPSNQLPLALWLESDRMRSSAVNSAVLEKTRTEILEENRLRLEREAYFVSYDDFDEILYQDFTYAHPMIGLGNDLRRFAAADVMAFRARHYVPNNALLCIVGNIDVPRARELVSRYFGSIQRGGDVPPPGPPRIEQNEEIQRTWTSPLARSPGFHIGYRFYPLQTGDSYTLRILEYLLLRGQTSRLHSRLVKKDRIAIDISGVLEKKLETMALKIFVINNNSYMAERSRRAILGEIERLKTNPVSEAELDKAKSLFEMDHYQRLSTTLGRALYLADSVLAGIPGESIPGELDKYLRVNSATLNSLAQRQFRDNNRVILRLVVQ